MRFAMEECDMEIVEDEPPPRPAHRLIKALENAEASKYDLTNHKKLLRDVFAACQERSWEAAADQPSASVAPPSDAPQPLGQASRTSLPGDDDLSEDDDDEEARLFRLTALFASKPPSR